MLAKYSYVWNDSNSKWILNLISFVLLDSSNKKEDPMESIKSKLGKDFLMSKDFAKKMESWNAKKDCGGKDHKGIYGLLEK